MPFKQKHIAVAIAVLSMGAAHATVATINIGSLTNTQINDPSGSGRSASIEAIYGAGTLTFSNPGVNYATFDAASIGGTVGALNVGEVRLTGTTAIQEQWKSFAQSGPGFETVFFPSKAAADADPMNAEYYQNGEITPNNTGSFRISSTVTAPVGSFSVKAYDSVGDTTSPVGSIQTFNSTGQTILTGGNRFVMTGGNVVIENMKFDIYNGVVSATVSGTRNARGSGPSLSPEVVFAPQNLTLWTFAGIAAGGADISGPTDINPVDLLAANSIDRLTNADYCGSKCFTLITDNSTGSPRYAFQGKTHISNLTMTTAGMDFFNNAFGSTAIGREAFNQANVTAGKWGSMDFNVVFRQREAIVEPPFVLPSNIPEPSTYALMGLGLVGISWATRRRQAKI